MRFFRWLRKCRRCKPKRPKRPKPVTNLKFSYKPYFTFNKF